MNSFLRKLILFLIISVSGGATFNYLANYVNIIVFFIIVFLFITGSKLLLKDYLFSGSISFIIFSSIIMFNYFIVDFYIEPIEVIKIIIRFFILSLLILYYKNNKISFEKDLLIVLVIFLIHSVINYVLILFFKEYFTFSNLIGKAKLYSLYKIFYYKSTYGESESFIRNQGFFWEPGVLQIYINILLFISIKYKKWIISILSIFVLISTFSTAGFIIMLIILLNFLVNINEFNIIRLIIIPVIILALFPTIKKNIIDKSESSSSSLRRYDFEQSLAMIRNFPLLGIGYSTKDYNKLKLKYYVVSESDYNSTLSRGNTNSIMKLFLWFGIPIALLFIIFIFYQNLFTQNKFIIFFIVILSNFSEPLLFSNFFLLFFASGIFNFVYKLITNKNYV